MMKKRKYVFFVVLALTLFVAACGSSSPTTTSASVNEGDQTPAWFEMPMTDVRSGEEFTISDLSGKVILVETMAMWCPTCLKQEGEVKQVQELLGARDDFVNIALDVDPKENAEALKSYVDEHGFDWIFSVASPEIARDLGNRYSAQLLNPPLVPMLIIDKNGDVYGLPYGLKSAEALHITLLSYLDQS
ncbi:MAG: TlpA disulfide reductase family protein [Anaerolineales bacterium]|jgi:cytochrome oxidase Cu insertion factor (SCO1/SenC/PrrC family)